MAGGNTIEFVLRGNSKQFVEAFRQAGAEIKNLPNAARESSRGLNAAFGRLGLRTFKDIQNEIRQVNAAYARLAKSGTLSMSQLVAAKARMLARTRELNREASGLDDIYNHLKLRLAGLAAAFYGVYRALAASGGAFLEFSTRMAEVNTLVDVSPQAFAGLSDAVRKMSVDMGKSASESAAALYDIISAGVPMEQAAKALETSTKAAVAGVTDTKTAANVGLAVVNAYGMSIAELERVYDVLFSTVRAGVTTLPELSQSLGQVLPIARSAGVGIEDVSAAIVTMTKAGIKTPQAVTALRGAITALSSPPEEAKKKFDELGITWKGLIPTIRDIAAAGLNVNQMRELIPDVEARTGVTALMNSLSGLTAAAKDMRGSAGAMKEAYAKMADTPEFRVNQFKAALGELSLQLGSLVATAAPVATGLKTVLDYVNALPTGIKAAGLAVAALGGGFVAWKLALEGMAAMFPATIAQMGAFAAAAAPVAGIILAATAATAVILKVQKDAADRAEALAESNNKLAKSYISLGETQRKLQAEGLGGSKEARNLARMKALGDTLRSAQQAGVEVDTSKFEAEAARATTAANELLHTKKQTLDAIAAEEGRLADKQKQLDLERARSSREADIERLQASIQSDKEILASRKQALAEAVSAERQAAQEAADIRRRAGEEAINMQDRIRARRRQGMSEQEAEADREKQINEKLKASRDALARGDTGQGKALAEQAFSLAEGVKDAEESARRMEAAGKLVNKANEQAARAAEAVRDAQHRAAEQGREDVAKLENSIKSQEDKIKSLKAGIDALTETPKEVQLTADIRAAESSIEQLKSKLEEMVAKGYTIPVKAEAQMNGGGPATAYASGGMVSGPGGIDRVPAMLTAGEYVIRRAVVDRLGVGFMQALNSLDFSRLRRFPSFAIPESPKTHFATGGLAMAGATDTVNINFNLAGRSYPLTGPRDRVNQLKDDLMELARGIAGG